MRYYWSPSLSAFNAQASDNIEVTKTEFDRLFEGQSKGFQIVSGPDGTPELLTPPSPSSTEVSTNTLQSLIAVADKNINVMKPAVDGGYARPEHVLLLAEWQRYRYELVLVPEQSSWPESPQWPEQPTTII